jgi:MFS transporter, Spinster family, sphingosine-1-phosphate transporter
LSESSLSALGMTIQPRWRVALFLFVAAGLNYADRTALASVVPPLREDLGVTDAQIGLAGLLFLWTYAIASPFAGNIADKFSRSRIVLWSLVVWSLITLMTGFAKDAPTLLGMRALLGLAESFYLPAAAALLAAHHDGATRGRAMGFHILGLNLGLIVGGSAVGFIAEHYGWRPGFWILGALGVILALFSKHFLLEPVVDPVPPGSVFSAGPEGAPQVRASDAWLFLARVPSYHCALLSAMAAGIASWIFLSWLPLFFAENYGLTLGAAGLVGVALYKAPVFVGIALGGWISDHTVRKDIRGRALIKGLSFVVSAPFLFLFLGAPTFAVVVVAMVLSSTIRAIGVPSEHPIICEVVPPQFRSTAIGIFNMCGTAAGGAGVLAAGLLKKDWGLNTIFGACSLIYILAGLLMLLAYWRFMRRDIERANGFSAATKPQQCFTALTTSR